jgi:hypothetical protein
VVVIARRPTCRRLGNKRLLTQRRMSEDAAKTLLPDLPPVRCVNQVIIAWMRQRAREQPVHPYTLCLYLRHKGMEHAMQIAKAHINPALTGIFESRDEEGLR